MAFSREFHAQLKQQANLKAIKAVANITGPERDAAFNAAYACARANGIHHAAVMHAISEAGIAEKHAQKIAAAFKPILENHLDHILQMAQDGTENPARMQAIRTAHAKVVRNLAAIVSSKNALSAYQAYSRAFEELGQLAQLL